MKTTLWTICAAALLTIGCQKGAAPKPAAPVTLYYEAPAIQVVARHKGSPPRTGEALARTEPPAENRPHPTRPVLQ
jgi:hypothetical protein